ncbi:MAG: family transcriptional regulator [Segetibacter sp.]|nr:family transcriptional regulator [Segetibacter sp.]
MKKIKLIEQDDSSLFDKILKETPKEERLFVSKSLDVSTQILHVLEEKGMLQKDLANKLGKTEAEISKWLSGFHNFTLKTISKIEVELEKEIITTPKQVKEEYHKNFENAVKAVLNARQPAIAVKIKPLFIYTKQQKIQSNLNSARVIHIQDYKKVGIATPNNNLQQTGT